MKFIYAFIFLAFVFVAPQHAVGGEKKLYYYCSALAEKKADKKLTAFYSNVFETSADDMAVRGRFRNYLEEKFGGDFYFTLSPYCPDESSSEEITKMRGDKIATERRNGTELMFVDNFSY